MYIAHIPMVVLLESTHTTSIISTSLHSPRLTQKLPFYTNLMAVLHFISFVFSKGDGATGKSSIA